MSYENLTNQEHQSESINNMNKLTYKRITRADLSILLAPLVNSPPYRCHLVVVVGMKIGMNEDRCTKCCEKIFTIGDVVGITKRMEIHRYRCH
jgi:hypothetical protein